MGENGVTRIVIGHAFHTFARDQINRSSDVPEEFLLQREKPQADGVLESDQQVHITPSSGFAKSHGSKHFEAGNLGFPTEWSQLFGRGFRGRRRAGPPRRRSLSRTNFRSIRRGLGAIGLGFGEGSNLTAFFTQRERARSL